MSGPTQQQIALVQSNLARMQKFNDYVYNNGLARIENAYNLLTETDNTSPQLVVVLNILEGAFWAIGSELGPAGNFFASFLSGMVSYWTTSTPPSLTAQFVSVRTCFQETTVQVDKQLATYHQDVPGNWNTKFTYNGKTGALSDLASAPFPPETDPKFETMAQAAILAFDRALWSHMLKANFVVTRWILQDGSQPIQGGSKDTPPNWVEAFMKKHPAYLVRWEWHDKSGCGDSSGWSIDECSVGRGMTPYNDNALNADACAYLFQDSLPDKIINPKGLFPRLTVFFESGLKFERSVFISPVLGKAKPSTAYLRAMAQGKTLGALIASEGRASIEKRVIERAQADPVFRHDLSLRPHETLEKFLGVKIPEVLSLNVVVENSRTFGLVIPAAE